MTTLCLIDYIKDFGLTLKEKPLERGSGQLIKSMSPVLSAVLAYRECAVGSRSDKSWLCWINPSFDKCYE